MDEERTEGTASLENTPEVQAPARKYREVKCRKCGLVHSSNDRECPGCGFSMTRQILKISIVTVLVLGLIASEVLLIIRINKLETRVTELEAKALSSGSASESGEYDITELSYYQEQLLTDSTKLSSLEDDYLIYAIQDGCAACAEANEYVYYFLYYGYPDYIPMYFVTPDSGSDLFFETLSCENTPTLYRMSKDRIISSSVGVEDVYEMLDGITAEANAAEENTDE